MISTKAGQNEVRVFKMVARIPPLLFVANSEPLMLPVETEMVR